MKISINELRSLFRSAIHGALWTTIIGHAVIQCGVAQSAAMEQANGWPTRPVRVIVPFGAGGVADILMRLTGEKLARYNGQSFIIDNRPGAGGNIGAGIAAKAAPDGYQLLFVPGSVLTMNPGLYASVPFDASSFAPVSLTADMPVILVVHAKNPARTGGDLVAAAKRGPGQMFFSSPGAGSSLHLAIELFGRIAGVSLQHIGYKSGGEATNAVLSSQVTGIFANPPLVLSTIKAGMLKALLVTGPSRLPQLPDVPTSAESGLAGFDMSSWFGLMAPAGTPPKIIDQLSRQMAQALNEPDTKKRLADISAQAIGSDPAVFARFIEQDRAKWRSIIRSAGIRLE
jgi:tripartite-type tricarboxylate transporter receptor subunit TctC